jgi:hypothetical protein
MIGLFARRHFAFYKKFFGGSRGTYSAVLRNIHGNDMSFETLYAVLALQIYILGQPPTANCY